MSHVPNSTDLAKTIFSFTLVLADEDEAQTIKEVTDPACIEKKTLSNGQPNVKTLFTFAASEEEAVKRMEEFVSSHSFREIEDQQIV